MAKSFVKSPAKILIQAIGNPLRSDDGVGPRLIERWTQSQNRQFDGSVDLEWVYQLQIENAEQWRHYEKVIVLDAESGLKDLLSWREIMRQGNEAFDTFNSHQQSPEAVYRLMCEFFANPSIKLSTQVFILGIYAENFELGESLSPKSIRALDEAEKLLARELTEWTRAPRSV